MNLRPANTSDIATLRAWDSKPHVIAASGDDMPWDCDAELSVSPNWRDLLIAEVDSQPIGVMPIIEPAEEESHYWGDVEPGQRAIDIWIGEETYLEKGYGTRMMTLALEKCFDAYQATAVLIDPLVSNDRAIRFYESLGFCRIERRQFGDDDCYVYRLAHDDWEAR